MIPTVDLQGFAKRILQLLGVDASGPVEVQVEKLKDGSVRIVREAL